MMARVFGSNGEPVGRFWLLSMAFTLGLHLFVVSWLIQTRTTPSLPQLLLRPMEVDLVTPPAPEAPPAPPAPPAPVPPEKKPAPAAPKPAPPKPAPPKPVLKPRVAPAVPSSPKPESSPPREEARPVQPAPPAPPVVTRPAPPPAKPAPAPAPIEDQPITQASFTAAYLHNPKPDYPAAAKQRGWEGTVKLMVKVSAAGSPDKINIHQSSGYDLLDQSAIDAVRRWRFVPAKRGDTPIASAVVVPLIFRLPK